MPIIGTNLESSDSTLTIIDGAIGVIMNVTELKEREQAVEVHVREKRQYMAKEAAAKEVSRLKSQFLANVRSSPWWSRRDSNMHRCLTRFERRLLVLLE